MNSSQLYDFLVFSYVSGVYDWCASMTSSVYNGAAYVAKGTYRVGQTVAGGAYAVADYATAKPAELLFNGIEKSKAMYKNGIFSNEYAEWSKVYNEKNNNDCKMGIS